MIIHIDTPVSDIPYGDQWLGAWAMREENFEAQLHLVQNMSIELHLQTQVATKEAQAKLGESSGRKLELLKADGVATIPLVGSLQKHRASLSNNTSTVEARQLLRMAVNDPEVKGIMLFVDSPGGTVAGTGELAAEIARAAAKKPVYAYCEDLCASAAYWAASQATKVFINPTGMAGSIGTYMVVQDYSAAAAQRGVKVNVIKAGAHKGAGVPGTEITAEQITDFQRTVNQLNEQFLQGVAAGRKLSIDQVRTLADGRVHVGAEAVALKLVDAVSSAEDVVAELVALSSAPPKSKGTRMSAATAAELKAACKGAGSDFLLAQLEKGATLAEAKDAWMDQLASDRDAAIAAKNTAEQGKAAAEAAANQAAAEAATKASEAEAKTNAKRPGHAALKSTAAPVIAEYEGDAIVEFNEKVSGLMKAGRSQMDAVVAVATKNPELHQAYLSATNPGRKQQRLLAEKFEE